MPNTSKECIFDSATSAHLISTYLHFYYKKLQIFSFNQVSLKLKKEAMSNFVQLYFNLYGQAPCIYYKDSYQAPFLQ